LTKRLKIDNTIKIKKKLIKVFIFTRIVEILNAIKVA